MALFDGRRAMFLLRHTDTLPKSRALYGSRFHHTAGTAVPARA
jgi:hypothetical protein